MPRHPPPYAKLAGAYAYTYPAGVTRLRVQRSGNRGFSLAIRW
jgi:hypothetical protein